MHDDRVRKYSMRVHKNAYTQHVYFGNIVGGTIQMIQNITQAGEFTLEVFHAVFHFLSPYAHKASTIEEHHHITCHENLFSLHVSDFQ